MNATWIDHHCHLPAGVEGDAQVAEADDAGVVHLVCVGVDRASSLVALDHAARHPIVSATIGLHPHEARYGLDTVLDLYDRPGVVAVGEAGLDYHYDHSPREDQRRVFADQIGLAHDLDLPLVVHTREAWADTFDLLDAEGWPRRTVLHCFTGGIDEARRCVAAGASLSFSGIVTFPTASDVRAAAAWCPLDRLLVETDAPYLAPVPNRGRRNRPAWVGLVGAEVARLKGLGEVEVAAATTASTVAVYGLDPVP